MKGKRESNVVEFVHSISVCATKELDCAIKGDTH